VPVAAPERSGARIEPGYRGFLRFCRLVGFDIEPYQRRIARAAFGDARELVVVVPKGNFKTTMCSLIGLHHLLVTPDAEVRIGAGVRRQAEICLKRMKGFARHEAIRDRITVTHFELRDEEGGDLTVLAGEGERLHGDSPSLMIGDEVWCWKDGAEMLEAMESSLLKRADSKLILITTAAPSLDGPLGRLRRRAMAQKDVQRQGVVTESIGDDLHWLEWGLSDEESVDDFRLVKRCNPAGYITVPALRKQSKALPPAAFGQFHANVWGRSESTWLPPGSWAGCAGETSFRDGERIWVACDVGGDRSSTALVWLNRDLHVGVKVWQGEGAIEFAAFEVLKLAERYSIAEIVYDNWRAAMLARTWEQHRLKCTVFGQSDSRMCPASAALYDAVVERRIVHPNDPDLNRHVATAIARMKPRGWRLDKANEADQIDAVVSLAMALEAATAPEPPPTRVLGWL
jgi:phage terminase large subunit-like protein